MCESAKEVAAVAAECLRVVVAAAAVVVGV